MALQETRNLCWTKTNRKRSKAKFNPDWEAKYPLSRTDGKHRLKCTPCKKNVTYHHQGVKDEYDHCNGAIHKANVKSLK